MADKNELRITRTFNASKEQVWHAWSDEEHFKQWWGPKEFTCPDCTLDFTVGGKWLASMMDSQGVKIWATGVYKEIIPFEKIVFTDCFADEKSNVISSEVYGMKGVPMEMLVTVLLKDIGGKTEMTIIHEGLPEGDLRKGANTGWNTSIDKMEESFK
ncbi:MAG TPA: SRPBCC domain-containing protein [Ignavibacteria bacterium]|nr:SRPBCC domain-containing protein [Ignavibacteria bacterium]